MRERIVKIFFAAHAVENDSDHNHGRGKKMSLHLHGRIEKFRNLLAHLKKSKCSTYQKALKEF